MNEDRRLEELLRNAGKVEVPKLDGVGDRTVKRLFQSGQLRPRGKRLIAVKNFGIVAAACLLLLVGYFSTQGILNWWPANKNLDFSNDPRIIEVQDQVPFSLALPTYLPRGYSLSGIELEWDMESSDPKVILSFSGADGCEPITITQGTVMELNVYNPADLRYVHFNSPDLDDWIGSDHLGWGGTRADLGYYYETVVDGLYTKARTLILIVRGSDEADPGYTYVTISSGSPVKSSQEQIADVDDVLAIAQGIVGAKVELISPGEGELRNKWPLVMPSHLPPGFNLRSMSLRGYLEGGPHYYGKLKYATANGSDTLYIQQQQARGGLGVPLRAEEVQLSTPWFPITGYYYYIESDATQVLCFNIPGEWVNNFDVFTESTRVDKEVLMSIAQSLASQYKHTPAPTLEHKKFNLEPTSHSLAFGPTEDTLVAYVPANGEIAQLWLAGTRYDLPGLSDYGPVWWQGEKFAYHVVDNWDEEPGLFYVYDTSDHSYIEVEAMADWDHGIKKPVILADGSIAVLAPGGLWTNDLSGQSWNLVRAVDNYQDIKEIEWSPDASRVAWIVEGQQERLVVLDVPSGVQQVIYDTATVAYREEILEMAWSSDSRNLAAVTNYIGMVWDGTDVIDMEDNAFSGKLSWVPDQDIISYNEEKSLALVRKEEGIWRWVQALPGDYSNYVWLANGNLAVVQDLPAEGIAEVTIYGWK